MGKERKDTRVVARLPGSLVARVDFVHRNTDLPIKNRSQAIQKAIETWLPEQEKRLVSLGLTPPKAGR